MPRLNSSGIRVSVDPRTAGEVRLSLPAVPENVAVVRQAMTGMTEALGLGPGVLADMKTAVSEACNNVVVHAYDDEGPVEVTVAAQNGDVAVTVRDHGRGISPDQADMDADHDGVGLSLIDALSDGVEIEGTAGEGTEVRMQFVAEGDQDGLEFIDPGTGPLLAAVLGRTVAMLAARANFSLDRLSDAQLVSDAVAAHALAHAADSSLSVEVDDNERALKLKVGPLAAQGGQRVVQESDLPGVGLLLEQLVDDVAVEDGGDGGETLVLRIAERP
jgi:serine/threonine-protein kinase RsbW